MGMHGVKGWGGGGQLGGGVKGWGGQGGGGGQVVVGSRGWEMVGVNGWGGGSQGVEWWGPGVVEV